MTMCADKLGMTVCVSEGTGNIIEGGVMIGLFPESVGVLTAGDEAGDAEDAVDCKFSFEGKEGVRLEGFTGDELVAPLAVATAPLLMLKSVLPILLGSCLEDK